MSELGWLDPASLEFPDTRHALAEPNGLLAVGGDLSPARLIAAYRRGIFPWYSADQPILWWSPSPRTVLFPAQLHLGRSVRKLARKKLFSITVDRCFDQVVSHCANTPRQGEAGTWITEPMREAYLCLHQLGRAHSVEAWQGETLVGGLYGVSLGGAFFGESMFSRVSGASKIAFASLALQLQAWGFSLIDCQIYTDYLASFGARQLARKPFENALASAVRLPDPAVNWADHWDMPEYGFA